MKHIFIVNPAAGPENSLKIVKEKLAELKDLDYEIYETKAPGDAVSYIKDKCQSNPHVKMRFYACGGDGTINEVANGIVGFPDVSMTVYPCGSGNDYVKYFGGKEKFLDLGKLVTAEETGVDLFKVDGRYAINVVSFGFDTVVLKTMHRVKRRPLLGGKRAYYYGVVTGFFKGMRNHCRIYADGRLLNESGEYMMCSVANGSYVGSSFKCAPRSIINDGLAEVCCFQVIPRYKIPFLIGKYINGTHLDDKACQKYLTYCRAEKVELEADQPLDISIDGEIATNTHFVIEEVKEAIRFAVPK